MSRPRSRGGPIPGYAAALSGLSDAELLRLLERRPDLCSPPAPASFPELAGRAGTGTMQLPATGSDGPVTV